MMVSPEWYKEDYKDKSLKELVEAKNDLLNYINDYENRKIINSSSVLTEDDMIKPSPKTRYTMSLEYLKEIINLILEKAKDELE